MKRINETTGSTFRRGDVRHDGYVFFAYTKRLKTNGYFIEIWLRPEASHRAKEADRQRHGNRRHNAHPNA